LNSAERDDFPRSAFHVEFLVESEVMRTLIFIAPVILIHIALYDIAPVQPKLAMRKMRAASLIRNAVRQPIS